jgi:hypothetical protein
VWTSSLPRIDAAAVAAHYGSISIVTFLAATQALELSGIAFDGYMVAVAAAMETPAIIVALWLARTGESRMDATTLREVMLNGSIVILVGSFLMGIMTGANGLKTIAPFIVDPFKGILCLFLLDMGIIAGRGLREGRNNLTLPVVLFGLYMPLIGAALGALASLLVGLSLGSTALMITLAASASYIAVPAALRLALPEARPSILACSPDLRPGVSFESGYFQALEGRRGHGTEGTIDGGNHRSFARGGGAARAGRDGGQDLPGARDIRADLLQVAA